MQPIISRQISVLPVNPILFNRLSFPCSLLNLHPAYIPIELSINENIAMNARMIADLISIWNAPIIAAPETIISKSMTEAIKKMYEAGFFVIYN
jgi:hypothetical protein